MVMVRVPVVALLLAEIVIVEVPVPVIDPGLNEMVVPLASPEADSETAELNPPVAVEVMVTLPELRLATVIDVGDALREKPALELVTVSAIVVVSTTLPEVPVTVTL